MNQFEIADMVLNIADDNNAITERLSDYFLNKHRNGGLKVSLRCCDYIQVPQGIMIADENIKWLYKPLGQDGYVLYTRDAFYDKVLCLMDVDSLWENAVIKYLHYDNYGNTNDCRNRVDMYSHIMLGVAFRNFLLHHQGIVIHASTIAWKGKGIVFSAPSGMGKSTHVRLWQEYFGNEIKVLNDDTPAVRFRNNKPYVFGTPWSGSSNIHCNSSAPLNAIVLLQQSDINSIKQISAQAAILQLMPRVFLPYFDKNMMNLACDTFERIVSSVPVFILQCRPDQEAVELVYQWMR
ncbi:MAG: hypothetical protein ABFD18_06725 [Syntrophomonas sp.]